MRKSLIVFIMLIITCNANAEVKGAGHCKGMALALDLPDEKVFETFLIAEEQVGLRTYGNTSEKYLELIQKQAYDQGYGAGLGFGVLKTKGSDFAFSLFINQCYDNDYATRTKWLAVGSPGVVQK